MLEEMEGGADKEMKWVVFLLWNAARLKINDNIYKKATLIWCFLNTTKEEQSQGA